MSLFIAALRINSSPLTPLSTESERQKQRQKQTRRFYSVSLSTLRPLSPFLFAAGFLYVRCFCRPRASHIIETPADFLFCFPFLRPNLIPSAVLPPTETSPLQPVLTAFLSPPFPSSPTLSLSRLSPRLLPHIANCLVNTPGQVPSPANTRSSSPFLNTSLGASPSHRLRIVDFFSFPASSASCYPLAVRSNCISNSPFFQEKGPRVFTPGFRRNLSPISTPASRRQSP